MINFLKKLFFGEPDTFLRQAEIQKEEECCGEGRDSCNTVTEDCPDLDGDLVIPDSNTLVQGESLDVKSVVSALKNKDELLSLTNAKLKEMATEAGLSFRSKITKAELVSLILSK